MIVDNGDDTFSIKAPCSFEKPKPLSYDEIIQTACDSFGGIIKKEERPNFVNFVRAIEKVHGIE